MNGAPGIARHLGEVTSEHLKGERLGIVVEHSAALESRKIKAWAGKQHMLNRLLSWWAADSAVRDIKTELGKASSEVVTVEAKTGFDDRIGTVIGHSERS